MYSFCTVLFVTVHMSLVVTHRILGGYFVWFIYRIL